MKTPSLALVVVLVLALAGCATSEPASHASPDAMPAPSPDEMMAMMIEAGTPGTPHEQLTSLVGDWDVEYEMWMQPGGEPMKATATSTYRSIMGGRFVIEEFHSQWEGMPFEGMLLMGYDNVRERYESVWIDNVSTGQGRQWGTKGADGITHFVGTAYDPMTPQGRPMRSELHELGPNDYTMTMYDSMPDGSEWMTMRFNYKRSGS